MPGRTTCLAEQGWARAHRALRIFEKARKASIVPRLSLIRIPSALAIMLVLSWMLLVLVAVSRVAAINPPDIVPGLKSLGLSSGTEIVHPSDQGYSSGFTQRWTTHDAPSYAAAVKPSSAQDVATVVCSVLQHGNRACEHADPNHICRSNSPPTTASRFLPRGEATAFPRAWAKSRTASPSTWAPSKRSPSMRRPTR